MLFMGHGQRLSCTDNAKLPTFGANEAHFPVGNFLVDPDLQILIVRCFFRATLFNCRSS